MIRHFILYMHMSVHANAPLGRLDECQTKIVDQQPPCGQLKCECLSEATTVSMYDTSSFARANGTFKRNDDLAIDIEP